MAHKLYTSLDYSSRIRGIGISSDVIFTIIKQDLEVAKKAVEADDFDTLLYVSNRIMLNLLVRDELKLMLLGYIMKDLSGELRYLKESRNDVFLDIKEKTIVYLNDIQTQIASENIDPKIYWDKYSSFEGEIRANLNSEIESSIYDDQSEFSKEFSMKLLDIFYSRKNDGHILKNSIQMTSYELSRNFNEHGGKEALAIHIVFKALNEYYGYLSNELDRLDIKRGQPDNKKIIKRAGIKLLEYIEEIYKLKSCISDLSSLYDNSNIIINNLGKDAKALYLSSGVLANKVIKQPLELPEDAKQKIGETIMKSLHNPGKIEKETEGDKIAKS